MGGPPPIRRPTSVRPDCGEGAAWTGATGQRAPVRAATSPPFEGGPIRSNSPDPAYVPIDGKGHTPAVLAPNAGLSGHLQRISEQCTPWVQGNAAQEATPPPGPNLADLDAELMKRTRGIRIRSQNGPIPAKKGQNWPNQLCNFWAFFCPLVDT